MSSTLGVLDIGDLVPGGSRPDAVGPPRTNGPWTVLVDDSLVNVDVAAPAIPVSGVIRGAEKFPLDDSESPAKIDKLPVASDDVSRAVTSLEGDVAKDNVTSIDAGNTQYTPPRRRRDSCVASVSEVCIGLKSRCRINNFYATNIRP